MSKTNLMNEQGAVKEITEYYNIKQKEGQNWESSATYVYIINKQWVNRWKQYTNKNYIIKTFNIKNAKPKQNSQTSFMISPYPETINNDELLVPLKDFWNDGSLENEDNIVIADLPQDNLKIISKMRWEYFLSKYKGGPPIRAQLFINKINNLRLVDILKQKMKVLFLPLKSTVIGDDLKINEELKKLRLVYISKKKTILHLKQQLFNIYNANVSNSKEKIKNITHIRLWIFKYSLNELIKVMVKYFGSNANKEDSNLNDKIIEIDSIASLDQVNAAIENKGISINDIIIVELGESSKDYYFKMKKIIVKEGKCPGCKDNQTQPLPVVCPCKEEWYCSEYCREVCFKRHVEKCKIQGIEEDRLINKPNSKMGMTALQNLGNTCFMNTSFQCISNCWELTNYFLKDYFKKDINLTNAIGTKGRLTRSFANILKHIWYGEENSYTPSNFKLVLENENEMYKGSVQQDTNEFLTYLLDCLHEDLNRVQNKPYVQADESDKPDNIKSLKLWYNFFQRNQSIISDLFFGQFQSFVYCPNEKCLNISSTFDPFLCLSLPLVKQTSILKTICYFIFFDISIKPIKLEIPFASNCNVMALRNKIAALFNIHPFSFLVSRMTLKGKEINYFANTRLLLSGITSSVSIDKAKIPNNLPYFLFQIDPKLFYNTKTNNFINDNKELTKYKIDHYETLEKELKELKDDRANMFQEDYDENETGIIEEKDQSYYQLHDLSFGKILKENNQGFSKDYLLVLIHFCNHDDMIRQVSVKKPLIFPRSLFINKKLKCMEIHVLVYNYLKHLFNYDEFSKQFTNITIESHQLDTYINHSEKKFPYRLRIINIMKGRNKPCLICQRSDCYNCLLPYSEQTLQSLIDLYPKNSLGKEIDNSYYFMSDDQKEKHEKWNRDFQLELTFLIDRKVEIYSKLNDIINQAFQITKKKMIEGICISKCLNNFIKTEELDSTNEWHCPKCQTQQRAKTKIKIYRVPHFIIIQLKRFQELSKCNLRVDFPINGLDMSQYVISNEENYPMIYDLFAIANHTGDMSFGHYYAICKNPLTNEWFKYDDSNIEAIPRKKIINQDAYILFYRRRNLENILDLQGLYNSKFINYDIDLNQIEKNIETITKVKINTSL